MESHPQALPTHKRERRKVLTNQKFALHGLDSEQIRQSNILLFSKKPTVKNKFIGKVYVYCFVVVVFYENDVHLFIL